jgi:hypothetical protein
MKLGKLPTLPWYLRLVAFLAIGGACMPASGISLPAARAKKRKRWKTRSLNCATQRSGCDRSAEPQQLQSGLQSARRRVCRVESTAARTARADDGPAGNSGSRKSNGLVLTRFNPKEDMQQDNYSGKKIEVSVVSGFAGLRAFFEQLAHYQRIVSITNFELKQLDKQSLTKTVDARLI